MPERLSQNSLDIEKLAFLHMKESKLISLIRFSYFIKNMVVINVYYFAGYILVIMLFLQKSPYFKFDLSF